MNRIRTIHRATGGHANVHEPPFYDEIANAPSPRGAGPCKESFGSLLKQTFTSEIYATATVCHSSIAAVPEDRLPRNSTDPLGLYGIADGPGAEGGSALHHSPKSR